MKMKTPFCYTTFLPLANGVPIPPIGFGTNATDRDNGADDVGQAVRTAIEAGYRYFETARHYWNEAGFGAAIRASIEEHIIERKDIWVVSKIWCTTSDPAEVESLCRQSLATVQLDHFDMCLMHIPSGFSYIGDESVFPVLTQPQHKIGLDFVETWLAMERLVALGLCTHIGVSNGSVEQLERILGVASIRPYINHIEGCPPAMHQMQTRRFCRREDILVTTAFCTAPHDRADYEKWLAEFCTDSEVQEMCTKYGKKPFQLVLRYLIQLGTIPVLNTFTTLRIQHYMDIFDFQLATHEMDTIDAHYREERFRSLTDSMTCQQPAEFPIYVKKIFIGNRED